VQTVYEIQARQRKVFALTSLMIRGQIKVAQLEANLDNHEFWKIAADECKINMPSMETRKGVVEKLREFERG
jgi:hypothetical protein